MTKCFLTLFLKLKIKYFYRLFKYVNTQWQEELLHSAKDKEAVSEFLKNINKPIKEKLSIMPSPRFLKTHIPLSLLPPKLLDIAKVVYVARDPRDVAVSNFHLNRLVKMYAFPGTFKEYWGLFVRNLGKLPFLSDINCAPRCILRLLLYHYTYNKNRG